MLDNDVAGTARTTAAIRARETRLAEPLFRDPLAETLAGHEALAALAALPENLQVPFSTFTVVRTRVFDDWLLRVTADGVRQVVLLGAGFDARAFRLDWPSGVTVWELDQPALLAAKAAALVDSCARPRCTRRTLPVDLGSRDWADALRADGLNPARPTAWLVEGVVPYLSAAAVDTVLDTVRGLSASASRLALDVVNADSVAGRNQYLAMLRERSPSTRGAPFQFGTNDPVGLLEAHGWTDVAVETAGAAAARLGRAQLPPSFPAAMLSFVTCTRVSSEP